MRVVANDSVSLGEREARMLHIYSNPCINYEWQLTAHGLCMSTALVFLPCFLIKTN